MHHGVKTASAASTTRRRTARRIGVSSRTGAGNLNSHYNTLATRGVVCACGSRRKPSFSRSQQTKVEVLVRHYNAAGQKRGGSICVVVVVGVGDEEEEQFVVRVPSTIQQQHQLVVLRLVDGERSIFMIFL